MQFQAVVTMTIKQSVQVPSDTVASVTGDSLLGGKYLKLEPGPSKAMIAHGGEITKTKDALVLEQVLGRIIFLLGEGDQPKKAN